MLISITISFCIIANIGGQSNGGVEGGKKVSRQQGAGEEKEAFGFQVMTIFCSQSLAIALVIVCLNPECGNARAPQSTRLENEGFVIPLDPEDLIEKCEWFLNNQTRRPRCLSYLTH